MKKRVLLPLLVLVTAQAACNLPTRQSNADSTDFAKPVQASTHIPEVTQPSSLPATAAPLPTPTAAPAAAADNPCAADPADTFDEPGGCWDGESIYSVTEIHNPDDVIVGVDHGRLVFNLEANEELYLYRLNEQVVYQDVIVEAVITNLTPGTNKNGAILACRVNEGGWYEVRVESGGFFHAYYFDRELEAQDKNPYLFLAEGGTTALRVGHDRENVVQWRCEGDRILLNINGEEVWYRDIEQPEPGGVGIGATAFADFYPVMLGFDEVRVYQP